VSARPCGEDRLVLGGGEVDRDAFGFHALGHRGSRDVQGPADVPAKCRSREIPPIFIWSSHTLPWSPPFPRAPPERTAWPFRYQANTPTVVGTFALRSVRAGRRGAASIRAQYSPFINGEVQPSSSIAHSGRTSQPAVCALRDQEKRGTPISTVPQQPIKSWSMPERLARSTEACPRTSYLLGWIPKLAQDWSCRRR
jgi:hypothetical protein